MRLDSVLGVIIQVVTDVIQPSLRRPRRRGVRPPIPPAHLGLAIGGTWRTPTDYLVAVRILSRAYLDHEIVRFIRRLSAEEVDIKYIGPVRLHAKTSPNPYQLPSRPLAPGSSIGFMSHGAGTLGCFVSHPESLETLLLTNSHVLSYLGRADLGDPVIQPGFLDGGRFPDHHVASFFRALPLSADQENIADAALAALRPSFPYEPSHVPGVGPIHGLFSPDPSTTFHQIVLKAGRTTGITIGRITCFGLSVSLRNSHDSYELMEVYEVQSSNGQPFTLPGDSGSILLTPDGYAVALHVGSSLPDEDQCSFATPLPVVLSAFGASLRL